MNENSKFPLTHLHLIFLWYFRHDVRGPNIGIVIVIEPKSTNSHTIAIYVRWYLHRQIDFLEVDLDRFSVNRIERIVSNLSPYFLGLYLVDREREKKFKKGVGWVGGAKGRTSPSQEFL